jgi:2-polyprenyl-3-methyl-5-hydroxy-6-metoxy-1,4-benzoquinol methylase
MNNEISSDGRRFEFGANWWEFLQNLDETRILEAEASLRSMLGVSSLEGRDFLDAGSGSGLFSLAARRLGAKVYSFDYDARSVACTAELKRRYFFADDLWVVQQGSVIDRKYMQSLGEYDIVYSWGVLHHTGAMWVGFENALARVRRGGTLFVAIYNDQGWKSRVWWFVKLFYNIAPALLRKPYAFMVGGLVTTANVLKYSLMLRPMDAIRPMMGYKKQRGMNLWRDMVDWVGGFPFEYSSYEVLLAYLEARGFNLKTGRRAGSLGCHEIVAVHGATTQLECK